MKENVDYHWYFCKRSKKNFLTLGYFGGGSINLSKALEVGKEFADIIGVDVKTIQIDEVVKSRRFKRFKVLFSNAPNQKPAPKAESLEGVWEWLED